MTKDHLPQDLESTVSRAHDIPIPLHISSIILLPRILKYTNDLYSSVCLRRLTLAVLKDASSNNISPT